MTDSPCESPSGKILVAGVGNRLMSDDGFGPRVVDYLSSAQLPENVELRDIGTAGLTIATDLEDFDFVIFLDSMKMEGEPGRLHVAEVEVKEAEGVEELARMSLHEVDLVGLLKFSKAIGVLPPRVVLVGCKPAKISPGLKLSKEVEEAVGKAADIVLDMLGVEH
jgi:hydrogenase maturation protease